MAQSIARPTRAELEKIALNPARPIPGQSLTNNPDSPAPYERPPQFTSKDEAIEYFMDLITDEEIYPDVMKTLEEGLPVMAIVESLLVKSFRDGLINPDMMLLLAEPLAYLLIGLAERQGIQATIVDDDDDPTEPWEDDVPINFSNSIKTIQEPKADEDLNLDEKIENVSSLMAKGD
tara:strand:+ start:1208 stop:1738 length:531 start_codon:yes stop_codon:yes gene_type:complete